MGCAASKLDNEDTVRRCKDRRRLMTESVRARHQLAAAHADYCRSLRLTGSALSSFAAGEPLAVSDQTPAVFLHTPSEHSSSSYVPPRVPPSPSVYTPSEHSSSSYIPPRVPPSPSVASSKKLPPIVTAPSNRRRKQQQQKLPHILSSPSSSERSNFMPSSFYPTAYQNSTYSATPSQASSVWNWENFYPPSPPDSDFFNRKSQERQQQHNRFSDQQDLHHNRFSGQQDLHHNRFSDTETERSEHDFFDSTRKEKEFDRETERSAGAHSRKQNKQFQILEEEAEREEVQCSEWEDHDHYSTTSSSEATAHDEEEEEEEEEDEDIESISQVGTRSDFGSSVKTSSMRRQHAPMAQEYSVGGQEKYGKADDAATSYSGSRGGDNVSDMKMVVRHRDLKEIVYAIKENFDKAAEAGEQVSQMLNLGKAQLDRSFSHLKKTVIHSSSVLSNLSSTWTSKPPLEVKYRLDTTSLEQPGGPKSLCSSLDRLLAWEKKLYEEVKAREGFKIEHQKKLSKLQSQEYKGDSETKLDKTKGSITRLQSLIIVTSQAVTTTSTAIVRLRDTDLVPQLVELCHGFMYMWKAMHQFHEIQNNIVQQVQGLINRSGKGESTSELHRQATRDLETAVSLWHSSFCRLIKFQREFIRSVQAWFKLTLLPVCHDNNPGHKEPVDAYAFCDEWKLTLDRVPDTVASEAIKSFINVVHVISAKQSEELKIKKRTESASKELEKKASSLRNIERKYYQSYSTVGFGLPDSGPDNGHVLDARDPLTEKKLELGACQRRVEEEMLKHSKAIEVTRAMTLNNLQTGLPGVFQALSPTIIFFFFFFLLLLRHFYSSKTSIESPAYSTELSLSLSRAAGRKKIQIESTSTPLTICVTFSSSGFLHFQTPRRMDLPSLALILRAAALSPNPDERKASEQQLNQLQHTPQHLVRLLQIAVDGNCDMAVRQIASIQFKNFIAKNWSPDDSGEQPMILQSDKELVRDNILVYVTQVPTLLRSQLGESLKTIIYADYPEQWPRLLDWVKYNLQNQQIYGALFVLRILSRKYEFKSDEERTPVSRIVEETFPLLLTIFNGLIQIENPSLEIAELMKLICKIFWSSIYLELPKQLFDINVFNAWMVLFLSVSERPVPVEGQPMDPELRKSWGWWKVKKWTVHILNRIYSRFGDPKLQTPENKPFAQMFQKNYAGRILEGHLNCLNTIRVGGYLPDRVTNLLLQYLSNSICKSSMYKLLLPRLDVLLFEIVFPLLCFNDSDQKLWEEDPHEYVRKGYNIIEDLYSPRTASMDFVNELVRKRGKDNLPKFVQFVVGIFRSYDEAPAEHKPYRQKDGAMLAVGSLCDKLKQTDPYKSELEHMLVQHIFPEFSSPAGHLRAKAAWVAGQYAHINFSDQNNFRKALHSVVSGMRDPELPVRVDSVFALRSFVEACKDLNEIRPILPQLLDEFFKLMNEVENEDLVFTLETIVDKFGEEMAPYAFGLCQNLAAAFWRCLNTSETSDDPDDVGALAAVGCLRAISTILESVSSLPQLFVEIEPTILPIMQKMLTADGQDVFEEVLEIASYMTFYSPNITLGMWSLWPLMVEALVDWAIDFFPNILVPMDNFISRGTAHFLTCKEPDYQQSLFTVLSTLMTDRNIEDSDIESAPKLIEVVFQNCKRQVDQWVEPYLRLTIDRLQRAETSYLKSLLIQVVANMLYYNPVLTLGVLHNTGLASTVFDIWFQMLQQKRKSGLPANFKREHDKKVCCLGLTSLLALPGGQFPDEALQRVFKATLDLLVSYKNQIAEAAKETEVDYENEMNGLESDEDDDDESDGEIGMDDTEDGDEAESKKLKKLAAQAKSFGYDDEDEDDSDDDDDFSDDEEFQSPIDEVDAFIFFVDAIRVMQASDAQRFQNLNQSLDFNYQAIANGIAQHAEVRRVEMEKEKQKKAAEAAAAAATPVPAM